MRVRDQDWPPPASCGGKKLVRVMLWVALLLTGRRP